MRSLIASSPSFCSTTWSYRAVCIAALSGSVSLSRAPLKRLPNWRRRLLPSPASSRKSSSSIRELNMPLSSAVFGESRIWYDRRSTSGKTWISSAWKARPPSATGAVSHACDVFHRSTSARSCNRPGETSQSQPV